MKFKILAGSITRRENPKSKVFTTYEEGAVVELTEAQAKNFGMANLLRVEEDPGMGADDDPLLNSSKAVELTVQPSRRRSAKPTASED